MEYSPWSWRSLTCPADRAAEEDDAMVVELGSVWSADLAETSELMHHHASSLVAVARQKFHSPRRYHRVARGNCNVT
jgi:hypothetical protein